MYKKILVPLDGSKLAECALSHVKSLVKCGVAEEVTLLNVVNVDIIAGIGVHGVYTDRVDFNAIKENLFIDSRKYLADVESKLTSEGIKVIKESLEGNRPAETISEFARNNGIDMIVIATHGYTGFKKLMLGSVALEVLHDSPVPVLLIRPESCR